MLLGKQKPYIEIEIEGFPLESAKSVNVLGITSDHNLTFDTHVSNICRTASANVKSIGRIRNTLYEKQANYCINLLFYHSLITAL